MIQHEKIKSKIWEADTMKKYLLPIPNPFDYPKLN